MGVNVGSKNHSRMFVPKLRKSMHAVTVQGITRALTEPDQATKRPPPFAINLDKATVSRRTGQMAGVILLLKGVLTAVFLSVLVSTDATGHGLASLAVDTLRNGHPLSLAPELIRQSLTAFAGDGQYMSAVEGHNSGLQVRDHMCTLMCLNPIWLTAQWDGAHCAELGMNTVRKATKWYYALAGTIANQQEKYLYGKSYERARTAALLMVAWLASVGSVCTTRFCHSERTVYKSFWHNLPIFIQDIRTERRGEAGCAVNSSPLTVVVTAHTRE